MKTELKRIQDFNEELKVIGGAVRILHIRGLISDEVFNWVDDLMFIELDTTRHHHINLNPYFEWDYNPEKYFSNLEQMLFESRG